MPIRPTSYIPIVPPVTNHVPVNATGHVLQNCTTGDIVFGVGGALLIVALSVLIVLIEEMKL